MFNNTTVPFTIIKEKNEGASDEQGSHYTKWEKLNSLQSRYSRRNIALVQEPTETLNMAVTFTQMRTECRDGLHTTCSNCGETQCYVAARKVSFEPAYDPSHLPTSVCISNKGVVLYDLRIDFHNYIHDFSSNYVYEVVCKIPRVSKPDEYLFIRVEPRSGKAIEFEKSYASTTYFGEIDLSNLYFGIRRLNNFNEETRTPSLFHIMSTIENTDGKDLKVILRTKDGQITVHKYVLSHYSEVFRAMFAHEMKENHEGVVDISDVESNVIQKLVDYLYSGKLENIIGMAEKLFKVAHRYQIHELCRRCEEYYIFSAQPINDNIVEILQLADLYELEELKNSAEKFVQCHVKALATLPRYQKYLCESINIVKAVGTLILADKYNIHDVKACALNFIHLNFCDMAESEDFLTLFESNPQLMKEIYVFHGQKKI